LIRSDDGRRLQVYVQIGIDRVVTEVILLEHGVFQFVASFFDILRECGERERESKTDIDGLHQSSHR
jgi:hypothetical protein